MSTDNPNAFREALLHHALDKIAFKKLKAIDHGQAERWMDTEDGKQFVQSYHRFLHHVVDKPKTPEEVYDLIDKLADALLASDGETADNGYDERLSFHHEGCSILNPMMSSCGRMEVDPWLDYGKDNVDLWISNARDILIEQRADANVIARNMTNLIETVDEVMC